MALEQKLSPKLQQKLVMTPALQLAIKLLQLNRLELEQVLQQEMVENPVLEQRDGLEMTDEAEEPKEADPEEDLFEDSDIDIESYLQEYYDAPPRTANMREEGEAPPLENTVSSTSSLADHLFWQLEMSSATSREAEVGCAVIGNLDEDGYLRASLEEVAELGDFSAEDVEAVLPQVQALDPPGIAARDLRECLLLQLEHLGVDDGLPARIVRDHLPLVIRHKFKEIARNCDADLEGVAEALETIRHLQPRPGQTYATDTTAYIIPDVTVVKDGDGYRVMLNDDGLPKLRVSRLYRKMIRAGEKLDADAKDYLQEKMRSALWLIKSFGQRQRTILKVAESIVGHQRAFLDRGLSELRPMVLKDVAEDIEMHESTVSRVVNGKYMDTPRGIYEMRFFFHSSLGHESGDEVSSVLVKERLRRIVDEEDSRKPLSDAAIAGKLKADGLQIARRTVAKYREELGIPASKGRKTIF